MGSYTNKEFQEFLNWLMQYGIITMEEYSRIFSSGIAFTREEQ